LDTVDDWGLFSILGIVGTGLFRHQGPDLVQVDGWARELVAFHMEVTHTNLSEVTGMVFVEIDSVMMLTTSVSATSGMLTVLTDTSVAMTDVSSMLASFLEPGGLSKTYQVFSKTGKDWWVDLRYSARNL